MGAPQVRHNSVLGCRLNWRRAGRLERAKECRGIKREQKGREGALPPLRRSLAREPLLLSSFVLSRAEHETEIHILPLSLSLSRPPTAVLVHLSLLREKSPRSCLRLSPALAPAPPSRQKPQLFVTHRVSSLHPLDRPSPAATLFRSHAWDPARRMRCARR